GQPFSAWDREAPGFLPARERRISGIRRTADLRAPLDARVAADRHQPAVRAAGEATREADVDEGADRLDPVRVLRQAHRPDEVRVRALDEQSRGVAPPLAQD